MNISSTYDWAIEYLTYEINHGRLDESYILGKTDKEIVELANRFEAQAQAYYDNMKEEVV